MSGQVLCDHVLIHPDFLAYNEVSLAKLPCTWGSFACMWDAGVMARTVKDVILFDSIFSDCHFPRPDLVLKGTRLGYPVNYWKGLDTRVRALWDNHL